MRPGVAVVPAAGLGTRMGPLTKSVPKEMLPVGRIPMIEHTIAELHASGLQVICVVIREGKEVIREYLSSRKDIYKNTKIVFSYQKEALGLGDALRAAKTFIGRDPFIMAIPDQILLSPKPAARQLFDSSEGAKGIFNSMVTIPSKELMFFPGARSFRTAPLGKNRYKIMRIELNEKSLVRGFGRTLLLPESLEYMTQEYSNEETGEVDLLKSFLALEEIFPLYGAILDGQPCDLGTWPGYYHYLNVIYGSLPPEADTLW